MTCFVKFKTDEMSGDFIATSDSPMSSSEDYIKKCFVNFKTIEMSGDFIATSNLHTFNVFSGLHKDLLCKFTNG